MGAGLSLALTFLALARAETPADGAAAAVADPTAAPGEAAEEVPAAVRYTGRVVAYRTLVAPEGGLPEESLEPLLRVQQDTLYSPADVRQDLAMLHRVLDFAQVEVDVEPWPAFDARGDPVEGVRVEYRVWPPPRIRRLTFHGNRAVPDRALSGVADLAPGDPFFADDAVRLEQAVRQAYAEEGWPRASAVVTAQPAADGRLDVRVDVTDGAPQRLDELRIRGGGALSEAEVRWTMARAGIVQGRPWTEPALRKARDAVVEVLRKRGYYEARVSVRADPVSADRDRIVVIVDPRRRWTLVREGERLPRKRDLEETLGLREGARLSRDYGEEAGRTLTEALRADSLLEADVRVAVEESDETVRLVITGDAGRRHRLRRVRFEGEPIWTERYLTDAMREASEDMLARNKVTPEAVDKALVTLQEFYRSQGYLGAQLTRLDFVEGRGRVVPVDVRVRVDPGPRTTLATLRVTGLEEVDADLDGDAFFADLAGQALNPSAIEVRARKLVDALSERGHLDADARTSTTLSPDRTSADVVVEVTPGPVVYLRTVVIRGYRRTRRSVIEREVDLRPGDPLAPSQISAIRRQLYELDVFRRVSTELVGDEDRVKDLFLVVEEKPNIHLEVGGGLATDQGVKVFARAGHRNLFGLGHRFTLLGQAGVGWVGDGWTVDVLAPEWRAAARYEAPHIPGRGERVAVDALFNEEQQEPTWRLQRTGGAVGVLLRVGERGTAEVAYRVQVRRLLDIDPGVLVAGEPWLDELGVDDVADARPDTPSDTRGQSGIDLSFVLDRRDDIFNPTQGALGSLVVTLADAVLTEKAFLRAEGSITTWVPVGDLGLLFRGRAGYGWVPTQGTLPLEDRFRLGGGASLRGFDVDSVGPANEVAREDIAYPELLEPLVDYTGRDAAPRWVPTGGDTMAVGTVELGIPFEKLGLAKWAGTRLALFADVGNVWFTAPGVAADSMSDPDDPLLRWSVGVGVRKATVIGPIQVDVGFNPERIEAREEALVRLHVSLGAL